MVRVIREKNLFQKFSSSLHNFKLFGFLGIMTLVVGLTFYLTTKQQEFRQRASVTSGTEFGFNTHMSAANNNLDINKFKQNVDTLVANGQKWIRFNIIDFEIASEAPNTLPTATPSPSPTPAPGLLRVQTNPAAEATITVTNSRGQVVAQKTWSIDWASMTEGQYTISYTYPYSTINGLPVKIPPPSQVSIYSTKTTTVVADLTAGTSTTQSVQGISSNAIVWNTTNLSIYDQAVDYARQKGLKIFLVTNTPSFAKGYTLDDYKAVTDQYYRFLSNRYKGKVAIWQVFNEADTHSFRDYSIITSLTSSYLSDLNSVIAIARIAIKANDPLAYITTNVSGYPMNGTTVNKWYQFFDGVKDNIDLMSLDMYPAPNLTEITNLGTRIESVRARYSKDVAVSETGVCTMSGGYSESDQANYLTKSINSLKFSSANLIILYEIMDEDTNSGLCEGTFGIVKTDGTQKSSFGPIMSEMIPLPTLTPTNAPSPTTAPTNTPAPTNVPTTTPTNTPTPTVTPTTTGLLRVTTNPPTNATINIVDSITGKIVLTAQWGIDWKPLLQGSYYVTFSYTRTPGYKTPKTTSFKIYIGRTTEIVGDFNTGKTTVTFK
jgi:hypothetical protein